MKRKLLFVDDDLYLRNVIADYLLSEGFDIITVSCVKSAFNQMRLQKPDLIITDIMMPSIDGYDFIDMVRLDNDFFDIPFIFLTAKGMTEDRIKGYDLGCNAYLTKPFAPNELVSIIKNVFKNMDLLHIIPQDKIEKNTILNRTLNPFNLTYRELTILQLVVKGYRNKEIAQNLKVSIRNVEKYVSRLLNKTSTRNRTELAQFAIKEDIQFIEGE